MNVYIVLASHAGGVAPQGVFRTEGAAHRYSMRCTAENPRFTAADVLGAHPDPDVVYVAQSFDPASGAHNFIAIHGNREDALAAAGEGGVAAPFNVMMFVGDR